LFKLQTYSPAVAGSKFLPHDEQPDADTPFPFARFRENERSWRTNDAWFHQT